jgi:hypothetical protein
VEPVQEVERKYGIAPSDAATQQLVEVRMRPRRRFWNEAIHPRPTSGHRSGCA